MENQTQENTNVEEETVTMGELVRDMDDMEKTAEVLFGAQDPSICTFPEGYKPRQTVFTCLTCTPAPQTAGVCYGCSLNCHEGHQIVELYTKRKFRCDCGNGKFGDKKCTLYEEKDAENTYNVYNHNYVGKFCICDVFFPDDDSEHEFYQCEVCEDWFHDNHLKWRTISQDPTSETGGQEKTDVSSIVCHSCVKKLPFLRRIPPGKEPFCHSKCIEETGKLDEESDQLALEIDKFRERLCKCSDCVIVYEKADCEFLMDDEDDIGTFERESKKKAQENRTSDDDEMRDLVQKVGMEGAQQFYEGVNDLKRKLGEFMNAPREEGKSVSVDDVKTFFAALHEDRLQKKRARFE